MSGPETDLNVQSAENGAIAGYYYNQEEVARGAYLEYALRTASPGEAASDIVERAQVYEAYVKDQPC